MQVQEIMHPDVYIADPNMTIRDEARRMRANGVGALPVGSKLSYGRLPRIDLPAIRPSEK